MASAYKRKAPVWKNKSDEARTAANLNAVKDAQ